MVPLARQWQQMGHDVLVLIPAWDCPQQAGQSWYDQGVRCLAPARGPSFHPLADPWLLQRCWQAGRDFKPDVVHVFKGLGYSGLLGYRFHCLHIPVFVDMDDLESARGWGGQRPWLVRWWGGRQERAMLMHARGVSVAAIVLKPWVNRRRRERGSILYVPNGGDRADSPAAVAANPPVVLLYTRGNDVDGDRLRTIWQRVLGSVPEAELRVVGDWPDLPALPRTQVMGWLTGKALNKALRGSALAIFPVKDTPLVRAKSPARLLDCLGQGLPIVTEDVGEYVLLAGIEQAVPAEDTQALAEEAIVLLQQPELRRRRSELSWQQATRYDWAHLAAGVIDWYGELIE